MKQYYKGHAQLALSSKPASARSSGAAFNRTSEGSQKRPLIVMVEPGHRELFIRLQRAANINGRMSTSEAKQAIQSSAFVLQRTDAKIYKPFYEPQVFRFSLKTSKGISRFQGTPQQYAEAFTDVSDTPS